MTLKYSHEIDVRHSWPAVEHHQDVIYIPVDDHVPWERYDKWGLYDRDGRLIEAAAYRRHRNLVGQCDRQDVSVLELEIAPPGNYVYGGILISHFGHFVLSVLGRFWMGLNEDLSQYKFICHGAGNPDGWWSHAFIREIFSAVGLTPQNFVVFKRPTLIRNIIIPRPSCQEHDFVHTCYGDWGNAVGRAIVSRKNLQTSDRPIWLSKTKLRHGVQGLVNEQVLVDRLSEKGVQAVYPEELSVADQVELFATRRSILGVVGSAFHASILWPPKARLVALGLYNDVNSNYAMTDLANRNNISYIQGVVERPAEDHPDRAKFNDPFVLTNVDEVVEQMISLAQL